jgi:hypothetical protein
VKLGEHLHAAFIFVGKLSKPPDELQKEEGGRDGKEGKKGQ